MARQIYSLFLKIAVLDFADMKTWKILQPLGTYVYLYVCVSNKNLVNQKHIWIFLFNISLPTSFP